MADSNKIRYSDLVDEADILSGVSKLLEKIKGEISASISSAGKSLSATRGTGSADLKKQEQDITAITQAEKAYQQVEKELLKVQQERIELEKKLKASIDENTKAKVEAAALSRQQKEIIKNEAIATASAEGSYNKLSAQYNLNKIALNAMSDAQRKNTAEGKKLETETAAIYEQMKKLQEATGKHVLSVGDYEKGNVSLKKELKNMIAEMAKMERSGQQGSEAYKKMSVEAGKLKDNISDATARVRIMSSDTLKLDKAIAVFKGMASIAQVAQGAVALLGIENENITRSIQKMMAIQTLMNGVNEIRNMLQSDSLIRLVAEDVKLKTLIVTQTSYNTVVGTSTGLMKAFKIALAATGIGAVVVLLGGLVYAFSKLNEATKEYNITVEVTKEALKALETNLKTIIEKADEAADAYALAMGKMSEADKVYKDATEEKNKDMVDAIILRDKAIKAAQEELDAELLVLQKAYYDDESYTKEKYEKDVKAANNEFNKQKTDAETLFGKTLTKITETWNNKINTAQLKSDKVKEESSKKTTITIKEEVSEWEKLNAEIERLNKLMMEKIISLDYAEAEILGKKIQLYKNIVKENETLRDKYLGLNEEKNESNEIDEEVLELSADLSNQWNRQIAAMIGTTNATKGLTEAEKELLKETTEVSESIIESYQKRSKAKEENLNKELEASKTYQKQLQELAKKGIESATENLAFEQKKQAEIEAKKLAEQKKQKRLELGLAAITAFGKIAETEPEQALTKTITEITKLMAYINALPTFKEGVIGFKGLSKESQPDDSLAVIGKGESVITAPATYKYHEQLKAMQELRYNPFDYIELPKDRMQKNVNDYGVINELKELKEIAKNKTEYAIDINGLTHEIIERVQKGNNVIINKHKIKGLF